jgi:hypothetical protein
VYKRGSGTRGCNSNVGPGQRRARTLQYNSRRGLFMWQNAGSEGVRAGATRPSRPGWQCGVLCLWGCLLRLISLLKRRGEGLNTPVWQLAHSVVLLKEKHVC